MERSDAVIEGLASFYEAYGSHDPERFAAAVADGDGISIIGTAPGEGRQGRQAWLEGYASSITALGLRLEGGPDARGFAEGSVGFALDEPRFVYPDGSFVQARATAVLRDDGHGWKVVHLHFSVGVPDDQAVTPGGADAS
jgi:hypothetical protein